MQDVCRFYKTHLGIWKNVMVVFIWAIFWKRIFEDILFNIHKDVP